MKKLTEKNEINNLVHSYFVHMQGRYFIEALKSFSKAEGYGMEAVCCTFPKDYETWEEGYFGETGVMFSQSFPDESIAIVTNEEFYGYVSDAGDTFVNKFTERKEEILEYLVAIKKILNIL